MQKKSPLKSISGNFRGRDIISLDQFDTPSIQKLFSLVPKMSTIARNSRPSNILNGKIVTLLFYEPSSRTYASFGAAVKQLGGQTIDILDPKTFSSVSKGETFSDTIQVFEAYSDAIVLRHPEIGTAKLAADAAETVPIVNAGDGIGEHPTQALLDLYTIYEEVGRLENLKGLLAGDILNGRTIHSLIKGLSLYKNNTLYLLSPYKLRLSRRDYKDFTNRGVKLIEIDKESDVPKDLNFWYWTRVQKERFKDKSSYEKVKNTFVLSTSMVEKYAGQDTIFMHPLPRVGEIDNTVDQDQRAVYLRSQIRNGMYVRMALMNLVLLDL